MDSREELLKLLLTLSTPCNGFMEESKLALAVGVCVFQLHVMDSHQAGDTPIPAGSHELSTPCNGFFIQ